MIKDESTPHVIEFINDDIIMVDCVDIYTPSKGSFQGDELEYIVAVADIIRDSGSGAAGSGAVIVIETPGEAVEVEVEENIHVLQRFVSSIYKCIKNICTLFQELCDGICACFCCCFCECCCFKYETFMIVFFMIIGISLPLIIWKVTSNEVHHSSTSTMMPTMMPTMLRS